MNVLHNLQLQFIVRDLNSFLNAISDEDSLTLWGSTCHGFRPINCTVSIPHDIVLTEMSWRHIFTGCYYSSLFIFFQIRENLKAQQVYML